MGLTPSLTLTCDITSNATDDDLSFLISIVVERHNAENGSDTVASITEHSPLNQLTSDPDLHVTGSINSTSGHLTMTWLTPASNLTGQYQCEANGVTSVGHTVKLYDNLDISLKTPNISDLVGAIHSLKNDLDTLRQEPQPESRD